MSSGQPPEGPTSTPTKDVSSAAAMKTPTAADAAPSRLEKLRAKVQDSRQKVADQKRIIFNGNSSKRSLNGDKNVSSSYQPSGMQPLHVSENIITLQEWKDAVKSLEQDKETLQKQLTQMKQDLLKAKASETDSSEQDKGSEALWEQRFQELDAINKSLKEQHQRDESIKNELSQLCESLEQQLEHQIGGSSEADSNLDLAPKDLQEAQARESILNAEVSSLQTSYDKLTESANATQAILEKELKDSHTQYRKLSASMAELVLVEKKTPRAKIGGSELALMDQLHELQEIIDIWKDESSSKDPTARLVSLSKEEEADQNFSSISVESTERKRFAELGDSVIRNLQSKVQILQDVVSTQLTFRRKLEHRVIELSKQVQGLHKEYSSESLDRKSFKRLSLEVVDANTRFAALKFQVVSLQQDLDDAVSEKEEQTRLSNEKEASLQEALHRNDRLVAQMARLEREIEHVRSTVMVEDDNSANEMEMLMELQAVRDQMDKVSLASKMLQGLLNQETTRSSNLTHQVKELKTKVEQLQDTETCTEANRCVEEKDTMAVLEKMRLVQEHADMLLDQAIQKKDGHDERCENDVPSLLVELRNIRDKVQSQIELLERAQSHYINIRHDSALRAPKIHQQNGGEMDIRVIDETSGRQTDLFVLAAPDLTVYDGIYNNKAVRSSNVRRWPTEIAQATKQKTIALQFVLLDAQGNGIKAFSLHELRKNSTKDFLALAEDPFGKINFVLRCCNLEDFECKKFKSIRISNEVTGRVKDIIVPISDKMNVFDRIYNNGCVRSAGIRKWPNDLCEKVSKKTHYIFGAIMSEGKERKTYLIDELKSLSTGQLVNLTASPLDAIQLVLKCKRIVGDGIQIEEVVKTSTTLIEAPLTPSKHKSYIRTRVRNEATGRFKDLAILESETVSLFEALYENDALRLGLIRRWPDSFAEKVKAGLAEIKCLLLDANHTIICSFTIEELKSVSTKELAGIGNGRQETYLFLLRCQVNQSDSQSLAGTFKSTGFRQQNWTPQNTPTSQIRFRITNQTTKRSKDIVIPISSDVNMFDGVYSHKSVLAANIRKWPTNVKESVKKKTSEIKIALFNGDTEIREFHVDDFKSMSTEQFFDIAPQEDNLLQLKLRWQRIPSLHIRELKEQVKQLKGQKCSLEETLQVLKSDYEIIVAQAQQQTKEQRKSLDTITTKLASASAREALLQVVFGEKKSEFEDVLREKSNQVEMTYSNLAMIEDELKRSNIENSMSTLEIKNLKTRIEELEKEKERLAQLLKDESVNEKLEEVKTKVRDATLREENLKEDLEMYKKRLHQELHSATANECSVRGQLRSLKRTYKEQLEIAKQKEFGLKNEIVLYKDKLQQDRYMLSCLSTELYDCLYREADLRAEVDRMESDSKHDFIHTEENAVLIKAEYAGVAPDESLHKDLDSAQHLNDSLEQQVAELESKIQNLEGSSASKEKEYQYIMDRDEQMKASVTSLTSILEQTTESNKALTSRVEELEVMCANLEMRNEEALRRATLAEVKNKDYLDMQAEIEKLKAKLAHVTGDQKRLFSLVECKESIIKSLQIEGKDVNAQERSKDILEMLEKSQEREKKLQMQYRVCVSELEKLTEASHAYEQSTEAKLSEAQKEVEEQKYANKIFKGIIAKLNQMNESLESKSEEQSKELQETRSKHMELDDLGPLDLRNVNRHLSEEVTFLREQKFKFHRTVSKLQGQLDRLAKLRTDGEMEQKRLQAAISLMEEEKTQSLGRDKQFDAMVAKVTELSRQLKEETDFRHRESDASQREQTKLMVQVQSLSKQLNQVTEKLGDPLRSENTDVLITKVREAEANNKKVRKERSALKAELDGVNERMAQIKKDIHSFGL